MFVDSTFDKFLLGFVEVGSVIVFYALGDSGPVVVFESVVELWVGLVWIDNVDGCVEDVKVV